MAKPFEKCLQDLRRHPGEKVGTFRIVREFFRMGWIQIDKAAVQFLSLLSAKLGAGFDRVNERLQGKAVDVPSAQKQVAIELVVERKAVGYCDPKAAIDIDDSVEFAKRPCKFSKCSRVLWQMARSTLRSFRGISPEFATTRAKQSCDPEGKARSMAMT